MKEIRWILGSGSPRRKELLAGIGVEFEVRTKETEEIYPEDMKPQLVPEFLAELKAAPLLPDLKENEAVICADTVVILGKEILGKPKNEEDAVEMLRKLSGKTHEVVTGMFIGNQERSIKASDSTLVTFAELSEEEIRTYISIYKPFDKAGSYGVQEWLGYVTVEKLEGTYTNVMGLPTNVLYRLLKAFETSQ